MLTDVVVPLLVSAGLAFLAESTVEYLFAVWFDMAEAKWPMLAQVAPLRYVALVVGVALAFAYRLDLLLVAFPDVPPFSPWVGILLTGLVIGRGANFVHDFWRTYLRPEPKA